VCVYVHVRVCVCACVCVCVCVCVCSQTLSVVVLVAAVDVGELLQHVRGETYDMMYASIAPQWRALVELNRDGLLSAESMSHFITPTIMDPTARYERLRTLTIATQNGT
jgi:hypothetical protein